MEKVQCEHLFNKTTTCKKLNSTQDLRHIVSPLVLASGSFLVLNILFNIFEGANKCAVRTLTIFSTPFYITRADAHFLSENGFW